MSSPKYFFTIAETFFIASFAISPSFPVAIISDSFPPGVTSDSIGRMIPENEFPYASSLGKFFINPTSFYRILQPKQQVQL